MNVEIEGYALREIKSEEIKYAYTQSQQLTMQCGAIGYLRGDFGASGTDFFTTWFDGVKSRNTDEFSEEFDHVINGLRFTEGNEVLCNRDCMNIYCKSYPETAFESNYTTEYGFRLDTPEHAYLIRCNPKESDYNFYVYPYISEWLDKHIENAKGGIRFIDSNYKELFRIPDGGYIKITINDGTTDVKQCRFIDDYHTEVGNNLYHICEFAERMENAEAKYEPSDAPIPKEKKDKGVER